MMKMKDKKRDGNIRTGTLADNGTPQRVKNKVRSQKLISAIIKPCPTKQIKNV